MTKTRKLVHHRYRWQSLKQCPSKKEHWTSPSTENSEKAHWMYVPCVYLHQYLSVVKGLCWKAAALKRHPEPCPIFLAKRKTKTPPTTTHRLRATFQWLDAKTGHFLRHMHDKKFEISPHRPRFPFAVHSQSSECVLVFGGSTLVQFLKIFLSGFDAENETRTTQKTPGRHFDTEANSPPPPSQKKKNTGAIATPHSVGVAPSNENINHTCIIWLLDAALDRLFYKCPSCSGWIQTW